MSAPVFGAFLPPSLPDGNMPLPREVTFAQRFAQPEMFRADDLGEDIAAMNRGDFSGNVNDVLAKLHASLEAMNRGITSGMTAFPVRENLEAEAKVLVPLETPFRNLLPRTPGSGKASAWKTVTGLGGGYGATGTTTSSGNSSTTITLTTNAEPLGFRVGDEITIGTETATYIITAISSAALTIHTAVAAAQNSKTVTKVNQADGSAGTSQVFFSESGAPGSVATVYADRSASYKLLGTMGSVTGFAMASGANFQNQYQTERRNSLYNLMLLEEFALINAIASDTNKPWGDGTTAYAYAGLISSIATGNGTPTENIVAVSGALTLAHVEDQLTKIWRNGGKEPYILCSATEAIKIKALAVASGSILRVVSPTAAEMVAGQRISHYVHPITGDLVPIYVSRFMPKGTMVFGSRFLPDGTPGADVDVLPQVQLPESAFDENIQGYTIQEIAPSSSTPQVFGFLTSVYEVFRLKGGPQFAKSTVIYG